MNIVRINAKKFTKIDLKVPIDIRAGMGGDPVEDEAGVCPHQDH